MVEIRLLSLLIILLLALSVCAEGTYVNVIDPVEQRGMHEGDNVSLGSVGPGQTIAIIAERATSGPDGTMHNTGWDKLAIEDLPQGWIAEDSPLYETPMKAKIKVSPDAEDGTYYFKANAIDENNYEGLGNVTVNVKVNVNKEIFILDVSPSEVTTGVGQPALYFIKINNLGAASDIFTIKTSGIPAWRFKKDIFVAHGSEKTISYEVVLNEENELNVTINVTSTSSELISKQMGVKLKAETSLISDYKATANGLLIFPLIEQPIYSLIALLSKLILK